ncbi:MAG TPA: c-type cytochrome [Candidatus Solibacter sp.]|nr:c-type cytochrome [Candidatus Solibacter sp.]
MFKGIIVGILLTILLSACGVYFYFATGRAPVATTDPPLPFEKKFAHMDLNARIAKQQVPESPVAADEKSYLAGVDIYKQNCAVCHGLPDQPKTNIAQGMYPPPPQLFHGVGVSDDPASETYWKAENGIRLTGMPGFKGRLSETEIWQVSVLLANSDKIPASVKAALAAPPAPPPTAPAATSAATPAESKTTAPAKTKP